MPESPGSPSADGLSAGPAAVRPSDRAALAGDRYKWVALSNTTLGVFMAAADASIVIISLPAILGGLHLDPLKPGNISYLMWMVLGYILVTATLVVTLGRLGDIMGRVRIYNLGFLVFTAASVALSFDPAHGVSGALWLIGWRVVQALGGAMLMANSAAILTDAFPAGQRGMALGINQIAGLTGQFAGLLLGGVLSVWDWRAVFWINVPIGVIGTVWAYRSLREVAARQAARVDWWGNVTFAAGCGLLLVSVTHGIQPYAGHAMGWASPAVLSGMGAGCLLLALFAIVESRVRDPMFRLGLFRIRAFTAGNVALLLASTARGGLQFMLIVWLQGIWLPVQGYAYAQTPLRAGILLMPLTVGFLLAGPLCGYLSDRFGSVYFTTGGLMVFAMSFAGLMALPTSFPYWVFAALIAANGVGSGMFTAPNTSAIMSSVPPEDRGAASGMRSTFQNSGMALSIGVFFSLLIAGMSARLPHAVTAGLQAHGVTARAAQEAASVPPVTTVFSAFLGIDPMRALLARSGGPQALPTHDAEVVGGHRFFPQLISVPFHDGLVVVFTTALAMSLLAALASLLRGAPVLAAEGKRESNRS